MAEIVDFSAFAGERDPGGMDRERLLADLQAVREQIARLDEQEPADMNSGAYEDWGQRHEELEDLADDLRELLDEL